MIASFQTLTCCLYKIVFPFYSTLHAPVYHRAIAHVSEGSLSVRSGPIPSSGIAIISEINAIQELNPNPFEE